mmetsp:Transcript_31755/g.79267  ORF Transcript_31755/g.79267 Transcript_31755/m.79267 type:complete len:176 (-) Transcript_31755:70-597(-)
MTGYATSDKVVDKIYAGGDKVAAALVDAVKANEMIDVFFTVNVADVVLNAGGAIGGLDFTKGVYKFTSFVAITSDITLKGSATDVFIFSVSSYLSIAAGVRVKLDGQVNAANILWQVGGSTSLAAGVHLEGSLLSLGAITLGASASLNGRALSRGAISLAAGTAVSQPGPPSSEL